MQHTRGLLINKVKSEINLERRECRGITTYCISLGIKIISLFGGLKYLGFDLKPKNYEK